MRVKRKKYPLNSPIYIAYSIQKNPDSDSVGRWFEPSRAYHNSNHLLIKEILSVGGFCIAMKAFVHKGFRRCRLYGSDDILVVESCYIRENCLLR